MTSHLLALSCDAHDPHLLAHFWAGLLGREMADEPHDGIALLPSDETEFRIRFLSTQEPRVGPNQVHLHLTSSSLDDQQSTVYRALSLGGRRVDVGQVEVRLVVVVEDRQ